MKEKEIKELKSMYKKYIAYKSKQYKFLDSFIEKLSEVTGKEIVFNEFESDGLGVAVDNGNNTYMSIHDAFALIKENGTIEDDDFSYL